VGSSPSQTFLSLTSATGKAFGSSQRYGPLLGNGNVTGTGIPVPCGAVGAIQAPSLLCHCWGVGESQKLEIRLGNILGQIHEAISKK
jgi:hypothetical protein